MRRLCLLALLPLIVSCAHDAPAPNQAPHHFSISSTPPHAALDPYVIVLGIAQDAGIPQAGAFDNPAWNDPAARRLTTCIGLINPATGDRWMFDATPDFRRQHFLLHHAHPAQPDAPTAGIFLTHAHIGHYTGLMFLGYESMGADAIPVHAMPRMQHLLENNAPWNQLVRYENITIEPLAADRPVHLTDSLRVTPFLVPHRQEYTEVVGFRIDGPNRSLLFIPDIDSWEQWDDQGQSIEDHIRAVDVALIDGTFFANGEIPGRDMTGFPHPFISHSIERFAALPPEQRAKIRFLHLNHTNPAQHAGSPARARIHDAGMRVAEPLERFPL